MEFLRPHGDLEFASFVTHSSTSRITTGRNQLFEWSAGIRPHDSEFDSAEREGPLC